jgi:signal transduction histidine kinase
MPSGGILRVRVAKGTDGITGRRGISVSVIDTGLGIRPVDADKLFQPFFTTKSTKGTGLGLWISKGIVQKYDGRISFRSLSQDGKNLTCFRVFLPADTVRTGSRLQRPEEESTPLASLS